MVTIEMTVRSGVRKPETRKRYRNSCKNVIEPLSLKVQEKDRSLGRGLWGKGVQAGDPGARSLLRSKKVNLRFRIARLLRGVFSLRIFLNDGYRMSHSSEVPA